MDRVTNRLPVRGSAPEPQEPPQAGPWGWIWLLFVLGVLLSGVFLTANVPAEGRPEGSLSKFAILLVVAVPLALLLSVGVGMWLARTRGWRSRSPVRTWLTGVVLFLLGTAAAVGLVALACLGAARL